MQLWHSTPDCHGFLIIVLICDVMILIGPIHDTQNALHCAFSFYSDIHRPLTILLFMATFLGSQMLVEYYLAFGIIN